jgi:hypothetical protein
MSGTQCYTPVGSTSHEDLRRFSGPRVSSGGLYFGTKNEVASQMKQEGYVGEAVVLAKIAGRGRPSSNDTIIRLPR